MKKLLFASAISLFAFACGSSDEKKEEPKTENTEATTPAPETNEKGLEIIAALDCTTCHKINEKNIGPAYIDVAKKYEPTEANIDSLAHKVIHGGSGVWGEVMMTPHPTLSLDSAKEAVKYILSLKNQ